jgi:hypothetical protein
MLRAIKPDRRTCDSSECEMHERGQDRSHTQAHAGSTQYGGDRLLIGPDQVDDRDVVARERQVGSDALDVAPRWLSEGEPKSQSRVGDAPTVV